MQHKKPTKEELKEDEVLVAFFKLWNYAELNYPRILAGIGVVVVVVLIGVFIRNYQAQQEIDAQSALGEVDIALLQGAPEDALVRAEQVAGKYGGKAAAKYAQIAVANIHFESERYAEAQAAFQQYLDDHGSEGPTGFGAVNGLAASLESQQLFSEAAARFLAYADAFGNTPFAPIALKEAARCFKIADDVPKAESLYRRIIEDYPESNVARTAKSELRFLGFNVD